MRMCCLHCRSHWTVLKVKSWSFGLSWNIPTSCSCLERCVSGVKCIYSVNFMVLVSSPITHYFSLLY